MMMMMMMNTMRDGSGPIPTELGQLSTLTRLWLFSNQLTGPCGYSFASVAPVQAHRVSSCAVGFVADVVCFCAVVCTHSCPALLLIASVRTDSCSALMMVNRADQDGFPVNLGSCPR